MVWRQLEPTLTEQERALVNDVMDQLKLEARRAAGSSPTAWPRSGWSYWLMAKSRKDCLTEIAEKSGKTREEVGDALDEILNRAEGYEHDGMGHDEA